MSAAGFPKLILEVAQTLFDGLGVWALVELKELRELRELVQELQELWEFSGVDEFEDEIQ